MGEMVMSVQRRQKVVIRQEVQSKQCQMRVCRQRLRTQRFRGHRLSLV